MSETTQTCSNWLQRYGTKYHKWSRESGSAFTLFKRPTGLVETSFDIDGIHYGGRADIHCSLSLEVQSHLSREQLCDRVTLAWAVHRLQHPLLLATVHTVDQERFFFVRVPKEPATALAEASTTVTSLQHYSNFDDQDFLNHAINAGRIPSPTKNLSTIFILPLQSLPNGHFNLRILQICAHMIADGISMYNWTGQFIDLINKNEDELRSELRQFTNANEVGKRLPPAQEDLYPPVPGNIARQRWFWAIIRILRHVRKPLPAGFVNPLRQKDRTSTTLEHRYRDVLDYSSQNLPPMNSGYCPPRLSSEASYRIQKLCREAKTSIGAGCFALVGLVMMELEEQRHPNVSLGQRAPFVASFPLNPRPFFNYNGPYDSCMLAFSDGIVLPFLSSDLSLEGRFRLLAKSAHRQLRSYQKRLHDPVEGLEPRSPLRMIAENYITAVERAEDKLPETLRKGVNVQGAYPPSFSFRAATCGVSSVGSLKHWVSPGKYELDGDSAKDLITDFRDVRNGVRARENEFLCGSNSDAEGNLRFAVSYDASAMDEKLVGKWKQKIEQIFEPGDQARL